MVAPLNVSRYARESREIEKTEIPQGGTKIKVYKYRDALNFAHSVGLVSIETHLVERLCDPAKGLYVAEAKATFQDGSSFTGIGDADVNNVNRMIQKHLPRMAETRAKARALGDALNLDATFSDEHGGDDSVTFTPRQEPAQSGQPRQADDPPEFNGLDEYVCDDCGEAIRDTPKYSAAVKAQWSIRDFGRILCYKCGKGKKAS